jgi:hypothetical protein
MNAVGDTHPLALTHAGADRPELANPAEPAAPAAQRERWGHARIKLGAMHYPQTQYARSRDGNVAYQVVGNGALTWC